MSKKKLGNPRPESIIIEAVDGALRVAYRWFTWQYLLTSVLAFVWICVGAAVSIGSLNSNLPDLLIFPTMLFNLALGIGLGYYSLTGLINSTIITISATEVVVAHTPLFWPWNRTIPRSELKQIFCERIERGRRDPEYWYQLSAITNDDSKLVLLSRIIDPGAVRYLEEKVEGTLGIRDKPVPGELRHR